MSPTHRACGQRHRPFTPCPDPSDDNDRTGLREGQEGARHTVHAPSERHRQQGAPAMTPEQAQQQSDQLKAEGLRLLETVADYAARCDRLTDQVEAQPWAHTHGKEDINDEPSAKATEVLHPLLSVCAAIEVHADTGGAPMRETFFTDYGVPVPDKFRPWEGVSG